MPCTPCRFLSSAELVFLPSAASIPLVSAPPPVSLCPPPSPLSLGMCACRESPPSAAMPLAFSAGATVGGGLLGQPQHPVSLLLTRGKHCRSEQPFAPIQQALTACFSAFSAPVAVKLTGQGLVLHADGLSLTAWLSTPGASALLSPLEAAATAGSGNGGTVLSAALLADDVAADMQCSKAFAAVMEHEASAGAGAGGSALARPAAAALRQQLASDIVALSHSLNVQVRPLHRRGCTGRLLRNAGVCWCGPAC